MSNVPPVPRNCLTVTNLPANFQELNVADLFVWNQAGEVAKCQGYDLLEIVRQGNSSLVRIPLVYNGDEKRLFAETGPYYVTFDMNVDALTRIVVTEADKILVTFQDGKGALDASTLPQALPVPYFTITGLPKNTVKGNFSEVFLYNAAGAIAKCADYQAIVISKSGDYAAAMIPLVYNANAKEYFRDSGQFVVTFTVNADVNTQIIKARADSLTVQFTDGSGELNLSSDYGYFSGGLANPPDLSAPVVKAGTVFEMNGGYVKLAANTAVQAAEFASTRVVYVYAVKNSGNLSFVYSDAAPAWNAAKRGYYQGERRALFKLVYLKDGAVKYAGKTYVANNWKNFERYPIDNIGISNIAGKQVYHLAGDANPAPQSYNAQAGWYAVRLAGAGGGGGINGEGSRDAYGGAGGTGGCVTELVYLEGGVLTLFTGGGGDGAGWMDNGYHQSAGSGGGGFSGYSDLSIVSLTPPVSKWIPGSVGGNGGGNGGDASGNIYGNGGNGTNYGPAATGYGFGGWEGNTSAAYTQYNAPEDWKNTNNANGQGGIAFENLESSTNGNPGGGGGNNRNAVRGGGGAGAAGGLPYDGALSAGKKGGAGYLTLYRL